QRTQPDVQPPPPPPPQQQPPSPPPPVIGPDDVIAEGARPDAQPKASHGDTTEQARAGSGAQEPPKPPAAPKQTENQPPQVAQNTNPNALKLPNFRDSAGKLVQEAADDARKNFRQGPRTGLPGQVQEDPNFSTEEPTILSDTKGYGFGPCMNQVVNRVRVNWCTLIAEVARLGKEVGVVIIVTI